MKPLEPKQLRFCEEYLLDMNATAAAIRAGYKPHSAHKQGSRILALPQSQAYINKTREKFVNELDLFGHTLMRELKELLHANSDELFDAEGNLKKANQVPAHVRGALHVQSRETVINGTVVTLTSRKLFDRVNVLIKMCKQLGWLSGKPQVAAPAIEPCYEDLGDGIIVRV